MTRLTGLAVRTIDYLEWRHQFDPPPPGAATTATMTRPCGAGSRRRPHPRQPPPPPQQAAIRTASPTPKPALPYPKDH